jgi:hypothetical protein
VKCKYCKCDSNFIIPECNICETCLTNLGVRWDIYDANLPEACRASYDTEKQSVN